MQSAYKAHHSCETAMLRILNDMLGALDRNEVILLALLDLSAAFDVVDHNILIHRLGSQGLEGDVLEWLRSYFTGRTQQLCMDGHRSSIKEMDCGMPQGSKIGPQGYKKFTEPLGTLARLLNILFHFYADDSQLWKTVSPSSHDKVQRTVSHLESAIDQVSTWMRNNRLKLNEGKTEFLVLGSQRNRAKAGVDSIRVGDSTISRSQSARNLGVYIDEALNLEKQISEVVEICRFLLRELWQVRKYSHCWYRKDNSSRNYHIPAGFL